MVTDRVKLLSAMIFLFVLYHQAVADEAASTGGPSGVSAKEEISLSRFIEDHNFIFRWSPLLDTGELKYGNDIFGFKIGEDFIIHNYREKVSGCRVTRKNGLVTIDRKTADTILQKSGFMATAEEPSPAAANKALKPSGHRIAAILIDPGHGGRDTGAIGVHESDGKKIVVNEKDIVLDIALELNKKLASAYRDKKIILTRNNDTYPSLDDRVEKANSVKLGKNEAIVFVSIHANASFNKKAKGFEVWYLPPDYRRELIDAESVDRNTRDILPILNTMLEEEFTIESILLAQNILDGIDAAVGSKDLNRGLKEETWFVVRNAKMPSVLVEVGFVSNREEAIKLSEKEYLKKLTEGIYNGIKRFIDNLETITVNGDM